LIKQSRTQKQYVLSNKQKNDLLGRKTPDPVVMMVRRRPVTTIHQTKSSLSEHQVYKGKAQQIMDSNVFGGVTTKLAGILTLEE
jgi:hypothetical protein